MRYASMTGRCFNGAQRDGGVLVHAIDTIPAAEQAWFSDPYQRAVCGARPGYRGNGWSEAVKHEVATCPRCLAKLARRDK